MEAFQHDGKCDLVDNKPDYTEAGLLALPVSALVSDFGVTLVTGPHMAGSGAVLLPEAGANGGRFGLRRPL